jgi:hypothetical protein
VVWAVSLSTTKLSPRRLTHAHSADGLRSLIGVGNQHLAPSPSSALPPSELVRGCTSMHFGENQLSPRSVGISPLSTTHPPVLQHWWVRASTDFHIRFTLVMDSSRGFGSHRRYSRVARPLQTRFPSGSRALTLLNLPQRRCTRRIILQKARHQPLPARAGVASDCW